MANPGVDTLQDILVRGAERYGDREAVADPAGTTTYAELATAAGQLARVLVKIGATPGDRVAVVLPNGRAFVTAHFANLLAGAVSVPCEAGITARSLQAILATCGPRAIVTSQSILPRLADALRTGGTDIRVVVVGGLSAEDGAIVDGDARSAAEPRDPAPVKRDAADVATIMHTTGTTGRPRGVVLRNATVLAALRNIVTFVGYSPDDREVIFLPLSHNFGLGHLYCNLMSGGAVYLEHGLARPGRVLRALQSFRATGFPGTPLSIGMLMDRYAPALAEYGRTLRFSVINSAPLSPERTAQLQALLPDLDIMVYYGLTEASRTTFLSLTAAGPALYRSVGRPLGHVTVEIRGDSVTRLPPGEPGEVVIRGPGVADGYWNDPAGTAAAFRDGWFHTGDIGTFDREGRLSIMGRLKEIINVGGNKVFPGDVERALATAPGILDAGVAGVGGPDGEQLIAGIVMRPGHALDEAELNRHCLERLESYKLPARYIHVDEIPRSADGKILREKLLDRLTATFRGR